MSVTINEQRNGYDEDIITELSPEEFHAALDRALSNLGITYEQLADQARRHDFDSAQAQLLWTAIGGTVDR